MSYKKLEIIKERYEKIKNTKTPDMDWLRDVGYMIEKDVPALLDALKIMDFRAIVCESDAKESNEYAFRMLKERDYYKECISTMSKFIQSHTDIACHACANRDCNGKYIFSNSCRFVFDYERFTNGV